MAKHIKSFTLNKLHRGIEPFTLQFDDGLNVIVGENGSGKSSILQLMIEKHDKELAQTDYEQGANFKFLDTEKCNPRIKSYISDLTLQYDVCSRFMSHGEAMLPLILAAKGFKDIVLIVDEPEAGISLKNQKKIIDAFKKIADKNACQIIVTTHSYVMIKNVSRVFCLDTKQWVSSEKYLESLV